MTPTGQRQTQRGDLPDSYRITWRSVVTAVAFFGLVFVLLADRIDPRLLYHADMTPIPGQDSLLVFPAHFWGETFFKELLSRPGVLAEYAGAAASQTFAFPYVGPAILTAMAALTFLVAAGILSRMGGPHGGVLPFIPPLLLVATWSRYTFHLADLFAILPALLWVYVYLRLRHTLAKAVFFLAGSAPVYGLVGGPYVVFPVIVGLWELLAGRRRWLGALCFIVGSAVPYLMGVRLLGASLADAYCRLMGPYPYGRPPVQTGPATVEFVLWGGFYAFFVIASVVLALRLWLKKPAGEGSSRLVRLVDRLGSERFWRPARPVLPLALLAVAGIVMHNGELKALLRINDYAQSGQWTRVLQEANRYPPEKYIAYIGRHVNRALFETRQLTTRMFAYPQGPAALMPNVAQAEFTSGIDTLLKLGAVNQAELLASESIVLRGPTPRALRILAQVFMIKGQPESARVFLTKLSKDIVNARWARGQLRRMDEDPTMSWDPKVTYARQVMPTRREHDPAIPARSLGALLDANSENRMAFEYLMAYSLLTRQLELGARTLQFHLRDSEGYELPDHHGELVLMYFYTTGDHLALGQSRVSLGLQDQANRFVEIRGRHVDNSDALADALKEELPNSFFRYFMTGQSGGGHD